MGKPLPPGWINVQLDSILTKEQQKEVNKILLKNGKSKQIAELGAYLRTLSTELEKKGVYADYLAHLLYAKHNNII